jgi:hypothetical protein
MHKRTALRAVFFAAIAGTQAHAAALRGRVRVVNTELPVQHAEAVLDAEPPDGTPEASAKTDVLGEFTAPDLFPGAYRITLSHPGFQTRTVNVTLDGDHKQKFELTPTGETLFPVQFQAYDIRSNAALPEVVFTVERFSNAAASGPPEFTFNCPGDAYGACGHPALKAGYYRVTARRYAWEDLVYPASGAVLWQKGQSAVANLKPITRPLRVEVLGYDPAEDFFFESYLKGVTVEITGLDFTTGRVLVAPRAATTDENGIVDFPDPSSASSKSPSGRRWSRCSTCKSSPPSSTGGSSPWTSCSPGPTPASARSGTASSSPERRPASSSSSSARSTSCRPRRRSSPPRRTPRGPFH